MADLFSGDDPDAVEVCFDGACEPNPGGPMAWAWRVRRGGVTLAEGAAAKPAAPANTNNVAEYYGLGSGLAWLAGAALGPPAVRLVGDSKLVVNQVAGVWACHAPGLRPLFERCRKLLIETGGVAVPRWVPRAMNAELDALAAAALAALEGVGP